MPVSATRFSLRKKHRKLIKKSRNILVIFIIYVLVHHVDWDSLDHREVITRAQKLPQKFRGIIERSERAENLGQER